MSTLVFFYGEECPHCSRMEAVVSKLENEGFKVERKEIWHNEANCQEMESLDKEPCGGVPFFINMESKKTICGEATLEELKEWAEGK